MKGLDPELLEGWEGKGELDLRRDVCIAVVFGLRHLWAWLVLFVLQSLEHPDKQPLCSMLLGPGRCWYCHRGLQALRPLLSQILTF